MKRSWILPNRRPPTKQSQRGFSLIEIILSLVVISVAFGGLFTFLSTLSSNAAVTQDRRKAVVAAKELMEEIKSKKFDTLNYQNPSTGWSVIGIDAGENAGSKSTFNDVDDYNGWSESLTAPFSWLTRTATVTYASVNSINTASASQLNDYKRITVQVLKGNTVYAQLVTVVSAAVKPS